MQSGGRADIVAKHPAGIWIFELKVDAPVEDAMRQIHEKGYATPYLASGKAVWAIGLSFDRETRRLVGHAVGHPLLVQFAQGQLMIGPKRINNPDVLVKYLSWFHACKDTKKAESKKTFGSIF